MTTTESTRPNPLHPAAFSEPIIDSLRGLILAEYKRLGREITVLDPLAGIGRVHRLARPGKVTTVGVEIEEPWAACHSDTICGDTFKVMDEWAATGRTFDVIAGSPPYGNRFSDHHDARDGSTRRSYAHDLGRQLTANNSGELPWGRRYFSWMARLYRALPNVLADGGLVLWNVSDFVKDKAVVPAVTWHRGALYGAGFFEAHPPRLVETARMGYGAHREARAPSEVIMRLRYEGPTDG